MNMNGDERKSILIGLLIISILLGVFDYWIHNAPQMNCLSSFEYKELRRRNIRLQYRCDSLSIELRSLRNRFKNRSVDKPFVGKIMEYDQLDSL